MSGTVIARKQAKRRSKDKGTFRGLTANVPGTVAIQRNVPVFLERFTRRKLRYSEAINMQGAVFKVHTFCANGLFDPNETGTGHQPMGFDQYMALYARAFVFSARITVDWTLVTALQTVVGVDLRTDTGFYSGFPGYVEKGTCEYKLLSALQATPVRISKTVDIAKFLAKADILDDPGLYSTSSANAAETVYFQLFANDVLNSSNINVSALVCIEYDVVFGDPLSLAGS